MQHLKAHSGIGLILLISLMVCLKQVMLYSGILRRSKNISE
ncbi:MAG: hypothetical protein P8Y12_00110 [Gammaproteobacteria bacterium]